MKIKIVFADAASISAVLTLLVSPVALGRIAGCPAANTTRRHRWISAAPERKTEGFVWRV